MIELAEVRARKADRRTAAEDFHLESVAALVEFAEAAEEAYRLLAAIPHGNLSRKVRDFHFHKALHLIARAGTRARAAEDELRGLGGTAS